jgi:hypothetical protein
MSFVKPNAVKLDPRQQDEKDRDLAQRTSENMFHIQKQLHEAGTSLEAVIAAAAQAHLGVRVHPHAPVEKDDAKAA